ncbi:MAG: hypothetical protein KAS77_11795, partial [Thermoplasmata archaeon]|nr:hypothetical protein [Thermoplasmata archaeon]
MRSSTRFYILALVAVLGISAIALLSAGAEGATYDVDLEYQDASNVRIARGLNPSVFNYTVRHTGTANSEEVYIDLEGVPPMWQVFFAADPNSGTTIGTYIPSNPFDFLLARNETCHLTITVTHAPNQLNRTYWFTVEAYPRLNTTNNDTHRFGVIIGHEPDCHIQLALPPASGEFLLDTPSITTIRYSLFNTGNGIDRYKVRADFSHFDVGWGISFESGTDEWGVTPNLTADPLMKHPHFIDISIAVPIGVRGNETGWLTISVTSVADPSSPSSEVNATFRTNQTFAFSVSVDRPYRSALPPDLLTFDLTVENTGNGADYFTLTVDHSYMEGAKFVVGQSQAGIPLDAGESDIIFFTVHVYPECPPMVLNFTAMVSSSDPSTLPSQDQVTVTVGQIFSLDLSTDTNYLTTEPGDLVEYNIRVKNLGNGEDTAIFDLEAVPLSWLWYFNPPSVAISSDDWETVNVTIIVPSRFEEAPIGSYHFLITATSENGNVSVPLEIVLEVLQV